MEVIQGFTFGVDAVKSLLLMSAVMEKRLKVQEAVDLSRLELKFQVKLYLSLVFLFNIFFKSPKNFRLIIGAM
jgi:hypothetical protein